MYQNSFKVLIALVAILSAAIAQPAPVTPPPLPSTCPTNLSFTDTDILNFALNLECLEAEFYSWVAFGRGLSPYLLGGGPGSVGGQKAQIPIAGLEIFTELAIDEINHVTGLRQALGPAAVPCPKLDIGPAFATAANLAYNQTLSPAFDPYTGDLFTLIAALTLEDVGVTAYVGAAPYVISKTILQTASKILAVEAYHSGAVRALLADQLNVVSPWGQTLGQITNAISDLRDRLAGGERDQGVLNTTTGGSNLAPTDPLGLAFPRLP